MSWVEGSASRRPQSRGDRRLGAVHYLWALLGLVGGLIGWITLRDRDPRLATRVLVAGAIVTGVSTLLSVLLLLTVFSVSETLVPPNLTPSSIATTTTTSGARAVQKTLTPAQASAITKAKAVPESVLAQVGLPSVIVDVPRALSATAPLTAGSLPELLFVDADYCSFCAVERWALVIALSKFGNFTGLTISASSPSEFGGAIESVSFYGSKYESPYLEFQSYDVSTRQRAPAGAPCNVDGYVCLQTMSASASQLLQTLAGGAFPFFDFGGEADQGGSGFGNQPLVLQGLTVSQIASQLDIPDSQVAQAEDGSADYFIAAICLMTNGNPGSVCSDSYIKQAQTRILAASK